MSDTIKKNPIVTNKQFQEVLAKYDDNYIVCVNKAFPWETKSKLVNPEMYVNTDIGQIELEYYGSENEDDSQHESLDEVIDSVREWFLKNVSDWESEGDYDYGDHSLHYDSKKDIYEMLNDMENDIRAKFKK